MKKKEHFFDRKNFRRAVVSNSEAVKFYAFVNFLLEQGGER